MGKKRKRRNMRGFQCGDEPFEPSCNIVSMPPWWQTADPNHCHKHKYNTNFPVSIVDDDF